MRVSSVLFGLLFVVYGSAWSQSDEAEVEQMSSSQAQMSEPAAQDQLAPGATTENDPRRVRRLGDVISEGTQEWSLDISAIDVPQTPVQPQPQVTLPNAQDDAQLQNLLAQRAFQPDNPEIAAELTGLLDGVEAQAGAALNAGNLALAQRLVGVLSELDEQRPVIAQLAAERQRRADLAALLEQASIALEQDSLLEPAESSAWTLYEQALVLDPQNEAALAGQENVRTALTSRIRILTEDGDFETATEWLAQADELNYAPLQLEQLASEIEVAQVQEMDRLLITTREAIDNAEFEIAERQINDLVGLGVEAALVERLRTSLDDAQRYGGFEPGQQFQDELGNGEAFGPVMIVVPTGSFVMGSPENEDERVNNEGPQFRVNFERGFALSRTEISVAQFRQFIAETGYTTDAERKGRSRVYRQASGRTDAQNGITWQNDYLGDEAEDELPVIHVSFNDAQAYVDWLTRRTGRSYRLPSEAEFEYALRAESTTPYWWGEESPQQPTENVTGDGDEFTDQRSWTNAFRRYNDGFWGPAPVASLMANPFGLFDMGGNVMEWIEDCWHDSYVRAPNDGSAWVNPGCNRRMIRGASWSSTPAMSRSAYRLSSALDDTDPRLGFRVARDL
ncbi:MAG: formylglycine-generating enzyme family protein [Pseudomonadota bacterium]